MLIDILQYSAGIFGGHYLHNWNFMRPSFVIKDFIRLLFCPKLRCQYFFLVLSFASNVTKNGTMRFQI